MAIFEEPSGRILDEAPIRAVKFLGTLSTNPQIFALLATRGYARPVHDRGWELQLTASGYRRARPVALDDPAARAAIAELDAWDEPNFRIAFAALADEFLEQASYVFQDLEPATGSAAIVSVKTFLDRLDDLQDGKDRKATRKADHAALAKLADRKITPGERVRLRKLIDVAVGAPTDVPDADAAPASTEAAQRVAKRALWGWLNEWTEVAKAVIKRRDYLILLGLAKRKTGKTKQKNENAKKAEAGGAIVSKAGPQGGDGGVK